MKKQKIKFFFFLIFIQTYLLSSVNVPLNLNLAAGYRKDHFDWQINSDNLLIYKEKYQHPQYLQTLATLTNINRGFYFSMQQGYASLLTHKMILEDKETNLFTFNYNLSGYDLETLGEIGYAENLTPSRTYQFIVIPIFGYAGFWKIYNKKNPSPDPYISIEDNVTNNIFSRSGHSKLKQVWYGPYVGGKIKVCPNSSFVFDIGYHFNWLKLKNKFSSALETFKYDQDDLLIERKEFLKKMNDTIKDGYGHYAMLKAIYNLSERFNIALHGRYTYVMADKEKGVLEEVTKNIFPVNNSSESYLENKVLARWWTFTSMIELLFYF